MVVIKTIEIMFTLFYIGIVVANINVPAKEGFADTNVPMLPIYVAVCCIGRLIKFLETIGA